MDEWQEHKPQSPMFSDYLGVNTNISQQEQLGWNSFMHVFLSTKWKSIYENHCTWLKNHKTGTSSASMFIQKRWILQHNMWISRNLIVHPVDKIIELLDITYANEETIIEFVMERGPLPQHMAHLFIGKITTILHKSINGKIKWLISISTIRDQFSSNYIFQ